MTLVQKLSIKISETRQSLNTLAAKESLGDGEAEKVEELRRELDQAEVQYRAAVASEADSETRAMAEFDGDAESAERSKLLREVRMTDYLGFASSGVGLSGRSAELNAALDVGPSQSGGVMIPWEILSGPETRRQGNGNGNGEQRAFSTTTQLAGGVAQRPVLQRLFGSGILEILGVRLDAIPSGRAEWPLLSSGVSPAQLEEGSAVPDADIVAPGFVTEILKPKKLVGVYEYSHEQGAQVPTIEEALRRDLADSILAQMSAGVLLGDEDNHPEQVNGFLTTIAAPMDPGSESGFADYSSAASAAVDGIHAGSETEVACLLGVDSYKHAAKVFQAGSGESGTEALRKRSMMCMASSFVPAAVGDIQNGNILHAAGPNGGAARGDSVAGIFSGGALVIRDPYQKATVGVVLTHIVLWDFRAALRTGSYRRVSFQLA